MPRVFGIMGHAVSRARLEGAYFRIVIAASITKLVSTAVGDFLLAINRPNAVMIAAAIGVVCNSSMGWYLMLASFGPHLGVVGAAWAQNTGLAVGWWILVVFPRQPAGEDNV